MISCVSLPHLKLGNGWSISFFSLWDKFVLQILWYFISIVLLCFQRTCLFVSQGIKSLAIYTEAFVTSRHLCVDCEHCEELVGNLFWEGLREKYRDDGPLGIKSVVLGWWHAGHVTFWPSWQFLQWIFSKNIRRQLNSVLFIIRSSSSGFGVAGVMEKKKKKEVSFWSIFSSAKQSRNRETVKPLFLIVW